MNSFFSAKWLITFRNNHPKKNYVLQLNNNQCSKMANKALNPETWKSLAIEMKQKTTHTQSKRERQMFGCTFGWMKPYLIIAGIRSFSAFLYNKCAIQPLLSQSTLSLYHRAPSFVSCTAIHTHR